MARNINDSGIKRTSVGGIAFFLSLFCLITLSALNLFILPMLIDYSALRHLAVFLSGSIIGGWAADTFLKGKLSVFIHELKHHIPSHFARNKTKGWKIRGDSGEYRYSYTSAT